MWTLLSFVRNVGISSFCFLSLSSNNKEETTTFQQQSFEKMNSTTLDNIPNFLKHAFSKQSSSFLQTLPTSIQYSIFEGTSALRSLNIIVPFNLTDDDDYDSSSSRELDETTLHEIGMILLQPPYYHHKNLAALFFILSSSSLSNKLDIAHEILLGVNFTNIQEAEYAATHPGQTNWYQNHPLSQSDQYLHGIIHRMEGSNIGEGGLTGYENAKYWLSQSFHNNNTMFESSISQFMHQKLQNHPSYNTKKCFNSESDDDDGISKWDPIKFTQWVQNTISTDSSNPINHDEEFTIRQILWYELEFIFFWEMKEQFNSTGRYF